MGSSPRGEKESEETEHTSIHSSILLLRVTQVLTVIHNFGLGERKGLPTPVFWPGEFHGLYSPQGHKESDTTERLTHTHTSSWQGGGGGASDYLRFLF